MTSVILLILIGISATIGLFFLNIILGVVCGVVVLVSIAFSQICRYHKNNVIAEETISSLIFIISLFFLLNYFFISLLCITPSIRLSINLLNWWKIGQDIQCISNKLWSNYFLTKGYLPPLLDLFLVLFKETIQILQESNVKNVHPVSGDGIQTHDILISSRLL